AEAAIALGVAAGRAAVNPAPIAAQPPPFLALESVPLLGEKSRRPSTPEIADSPPGIADRKSDRRPSFAAERSDEVAVPSADRKRKPKQSRALTHVRKGTQAHSQAQLCAKSLVKLSFDRFFVHHLEYSKYWPFPMY
ncbi:hypothetical protein BHM03_00062441, partial [Ensete ventricosum]